MPIHPVPLRPSALAAAALLLVGCGNGSAAGGGGVVTATVDTVGGVERVRYAAETGPSLAWSADTVLTIGDAFAEREYQFNEVGRAGLGRSAEGDLLVLDRQGKRVLRYGRDGQHVATYGREGEGPGELSQPHGLTAGPGDTTWVSDFANSRLTGYPPEEGEARVVPFPENSGFPMGPIAALEGGYIVQFRPMFGAGRGGRGALSTGEDDDAVRIPLVRYSRGDMSPLDTLWTVPEPPSDMVELELGGNRIMLMMSREFHPEFLWAAFSDGGAVVSDTAAYVLHLIAADGEVERRIERDPAPRTVTEADREAVRERIRSQESGVGIRIGGMGPDEDTQKKMMERRLASMTFAELVPRIVGLRVDDRDRIWVGVSEDEADVASRIDVYDRDGQLLGHLRDFPLPDIFLDGGRAALLQRDELDVQQLLVLQVGEQQVVDGQPTG